MGYFVKKSKHGNEGMVLPSGPTSERPVTPITASLRYNTDTESLEYFNGTAFVDLAKTGLTTPGIDKIVTDGINASFTMSRESHRASIIVFIDGIYQTPGAASNYDTSGFDIVFTSIPPTGLDITIIHGLFDTYVESGNVFDVPNL